MVSDPSTLMLLKYGILCHKSSEKLHLRNNLGHNWYQERGGEGGGSAHARSAQTVNAYVLYFCCFNG